MHALRRPGEGAQELAALLQDGIIQRIDGIGIQQAGVEFAALGRLRKALVEERDEFGCARAMEIRHGSPLGLRALKGGRLGVQQ